MEYYNLQDKIMQTIIKNNLINGNDRIVLGVSGGPDSICMLDALIKIKKCQKNPELAANFSIVVAHINHLIRKEAKEDEEYVKKYCEERQIEFYSKSIDIQKQANDKKIGTEEAGRQARYEYFEEIAKKVGANKIAIAHNKNDKIETIIMNLLRGTGISGLKGIEAQRGNIIRPLIECERHEIEEYCEQNKLNPRIDRTNFENIYTRNKIRNIVIPYIKEEFNPNIIETLNRLSEVVKEEEDYIQRQIESTYKNIIIEENICHLNPERVAKNEIILDLKKFNEQEKVIKAKLILYVITKLFGTSKGIEKIHIEDIIKLCSNNIGNKYLTPNKNLKILIKNKKIFFEKM